MGRGWEDLEASRLTVVMPCAGEIAWLGLQQGWVSAVPLLGLPGAVLYSLFLTQEEKSPGCFLQSERGEWPGQPQIINSSL